MLDMRNEYILVEEMQPYVLKDYTSLSFLCRFLVKLLFSQLFFSRMFSALLLFSVFEASGLLTPIFFPEFVMIEKDINVSKMI